jgi:hypothetical protein
MEYQLGATASFLEGPRDLHCGIVIAQEELIVASPTVGKTFEARMGQSLPNGQAVPTLRLISAQFRGFRVSKLKVRTFPKRGPSRFLRSDLTSLGLVSCFVHCTVRRAPGR